MRVLGIETSCDDTGVAVYDSEKGLLAHVLYSQTATHAPYGGVVPELASRDHSRKLLVLLEKALTDANLNPQAIDGIAYTAGPGLAGALLVGATFAKTLGYTWNIPSIGIHHMEGHLLAPMLEASPPSFPFVALLVSGGHTMLIEVLGIGEYRILGESLDDAAGEAFDKTAKLLGLPYPGGPALAALAKDGTPNRFMFPRPLSDRPGFDFSFSGLKTFTMNLYKTTALSTQDKADIAWGFQEAVVDTLIIKCKRALQSSGLKRLVIAGGVGANLRLREKLKDMALQNQTQIFFPRSEFCTDNGAMIAYVGYQRLKMGQIDSLEITVQPRWSMDTLNK